MRLLELNLSNFQGIRDAQFVLCGTNASIFGDNATGKTTLFNAVTWLLFGKASTGAKNFTPKTKGPDGDLHRLEHSVEAKFSLEDGQIIALRKTFKEDYKKVRGSSQEEFKGHVIDHFVDGVPVKEKDYIASLEGIIGMEEHIKMLMMPDYFAETLPWENRRRILLEMCGDVTDSDVIAGTPELADLLDYLAVPGVSGKHYTVDEYKKITAGKRAEINRELQLIPARIDEAQKAMPDISDLNADIINSDVAMFNTRIDIKEQEKRTILSGDTATDIIRKQISALETKLAEDRGAYATENSKRNEAALAEVSRLKTEHGQMRNAILTKKNDLTAKQNELNTLNSMRKSVTESWQRVNAESWQGDEACPTCLRPLPNEAIAEAKAQFNQNKSTRLEEIRQKGAETCSSEMVTTTENAIATLTESIHAAESMIADYAPLIMEAEKKILPLAQFEESEKYKIAIQEIEVLRNNEITASTAASQQISILNDEIAKIRAQVDMRLADRSKLSMAEQQQKRMEALLEDDKRLSGEYENLERGIYLCEAFIKAKVSMLTDKINSKFASVRFRLFIEQINGGIKEDCEVMVPSEGKMVPYTYANNAARINAGLEVINALAQHWKISVPVFVDNAESVTQLQHIEGQLIRLVVSESDKTLRLEKDV